MIDRLPRLEPYETVSLRRFANMEQDGEAKGGRLFLTNQRLMFRPHFIDRFAGGADWWVQRAAITAVEVLPAGGPGQLFSGGLRDRLLIRLSDGAECYFVVYRLGDLVATLRTELQLWPRR